MDVTQNAATRFSSLAAIYDAATRRHLLERGLSPGWHCLEIGGGDGSVARWLGERVGAAGQVVATDLDVRCLERAQGSNVEVLRHDVTCDPLPERAFDLVHTRMVLIHLPQRDAVLKRLAAALKPGGWLVCEEFDALSVPADPGASPGEVPLKTHDAMGRLNDHCRVDRRYGRLLFAQFRALGLTSVGAEACMSMVQSGAPTANLLRASYELRRSAMVEAGYVTDDEFLRDLARMEDPDFMMPSPLMWTAWGRREYQAGTHA